MTTSSQIRALVATQLAKLLPSGTSVFSPRDWSSNVSQYPCVFVRIDGEDRQSLGPNTAQEFETVVTIKVTARVQAPAQANDQGAVAAELALETLKSQIDAALINNPAITVVTEQFEFVRSELSVNSEGEQHLGELVIRYGIKFYEGPEDFFQVTAVPLTELTVDVDLTNIFDPTGTYANPPFPSAVVPAPRSSGPDGRAEGGLDIDLPQ